MRTAEDPPVTVAVVSWNTRELLARCLRSLQPEVDTGRAQVWVVDNGSTDGSRDLVRRDFSWATLIASAENLGFGAAVDLVAEHTASEWLAAANADVALEPGALELLLRAGREPEVGAVGPRLVLPDGCTQHSVYPFPTLTFSVLFNLGLHRVVPGLGDRLCLEGHWDPDRPRRVDWAVGAFLLLRRSAFETAGGFDARQWMYAEDLDLGWRLADSGRVCRYEPRAVALHEEGAATSVAFGDSIVHRYTAATYTVLARRRSPARARATAAVNCAGCVLRLAWMTPLAVIRPRWRGPRDATRMWLSAHRQGLHRRVAMDHRAPDPHPSER